MWPVSAKRLKDQAELLFDERHAAEFNTEARDIAFRHARSRGLRACWLIATLLWRQRRATSGADEQDRSKRRMANHFNISYEKRGQRWP